MTSEIITERETKLNKTPLVSVIMGVFNCEKTLSEAVDCIFSQTYTNWELIMCDDGSTDDTLTVAKELKMLSPDKIVVLQNETNKGLNHTLNHCLRYAKGEYVARMDGDDLCSQRRFEIEVKELNDHPEIDFVSTDMEFFDEKGIFGQISHPTYPTEKDFMKENPFCHAPCMVRKIAFDDVNGYTEDERLLRVEDYHLWVKMYANKHKGMNIHQPLYQMRDDRNAYKRRKFIYRVNNARVKRVAIKEFGLPFWMNVYCLRPIITGLMPAFVYNKLHKKRLAHS